MLTLVFGMPVSKGKVNRSLDLCLIAQKTTGDCEQGFVFKHVNTSWKYNINKKSNEVFLQSLINLLK